MAAPSLASDFVRQCARCELSPEDVAAVHDLASQMDSAEWHAALAMARRDGLMSLVFTHASQAGLLPSLPHDVANALSAACSRTLITNLRMMRDLRAILAACAAEGVEVIVLKGVALAERYYGDLSLRPVGDIDLVVTARGDLDRAANTLRTLGYRPCERQGRPRDFLALANWTLIFEKPGAALVELHWRLTNRPPYQGGLDVALLWGRAETVHVAGQPARYLAPADELRYLSVHYAAEHGASRLIWLVDIAKLLGSLPPAWDWAQFVRETIAMRLAKPAALTLEQCRNGLDLSLPEGVLDPLLAASARMTERRRWHIARTDFYSPRRLWHHLRALEGPAERGAFFQGALAYEFRRVVRWAYRLLRPNRHPA